MLVSVKNISDPTVTLLDAHGVTPDGIPYYDFSQFVTGGRLQPGQETSSPTITFHNPDRQQFDYELVFYGKLNEAPVITTLPDIEALADRDYIYDVAAFDPDNDSLTYALVANPADMVIDPSSGRITWQVTSAEIGQHDVTIRVTDGRGGSAEQHYVLSGIPAPPNRPPVISSTPVTLATVAAMVDETEVLVDLSDWQPVDIEEAAPADRANWQISPDGNAVEQLVNSGAAAFLSDFEFRDSRIRGMWRVEDTGAGRSDGAIDDDFIGFVFGYRMRNTFTCSIGSKARNMKGASSLIRA
ncbi:MAG: putative Ig domain-containing protein [Planctomycetaceae bacterium]